MSVSGADGWPETLGDADILERRRRLNRERAAGDRLRMDEAGFFINM